MGARSLQKCRGCGQTLTILSRSLDVSGYCGKCAAQSQDDDELRELPANVDVRSLATATLRGEAIRFTRIAAVASLSCFAGAIVGAMAAGPDDMRGRTVTSLQASWLFCLAGLFVAKLFFLRSGNALTFARWKTFWFLFIACFFVTYIPLALLLPRMEDLPVPADIITFVSACLVAYAGGMIAVLLSDRTLKKWLCERCMLPSSMVDAVCHDDWAAARQAIDETIAQSQGLVSADNLLARCYLASACEKQRAGRADAAVGDLRKGLEVPGASDGIRFKIARALNDAGKHSDACEVLSQLVSASRDKDFACRARKLIKTIQKRNRLDIRCPKCGRTLSGTMDMIGDQATCAKCRTEFTISEDLVKK